MRQRAAAVQRWIPRIAIRLGCATLPLHALRVTDAIGVKAPRILGRAV